jgi:hypothetical protein
MVHGIVVLLRGSTPSCTLRARGVMRGKGGRRQWLRQSTPHLPLLAAQPRQLEAGLGGGGTTQPAPPCPRGATTAAHPLRGPGPAEVARQRLPPRGPATDSAAAGTRAPTAAAGRWSAADDKSRSSNSGSLRAALHTGITTTNSNVFPKTQSSSNIGFVQQLLRECTAQSCGSTAASLNRATNNAATLRKHAQCTHYPCKTKTPFTGRECTPPRPLGTHLARIHIM